MQILAKLICALLLLSSTTVTVHAQTYVGTYSGVITTSQIDDHPAGMPETYDFNGQPISGTFEIMLSGGVTSASYNGTLPAFAFAGYGSDSDDDPFDYATYSTAGGIGTLTVGPDLIGQDSSAQFVISFNLSALNNPMIPLVGTGSYNFYYNQGGTAGGDLDGYLNFALLRGTLIAVPEPQVWAMLIGGLFIAGASARRSHLRAANA